MRYSFTALVLATVTLNGVVAHPAKHGHAAFHAKKDVVLDAPLEAGAEVKRDLPVDWTKVKYTYSAGQTWGQPTAAVAAAAAAPAVATAAPEAKVAAATTAAAKAAATTAAAVASSGKVSSALSSISESKLSSLGVLAKGINALSSSGGVWLGNDGPYVNEFTNSYSDDIILTIWGPLASWVNVKAPLITVTLGAGEKTTVSFASGQTGSWAAIYPDTILLNGQVSNTWGEYTFSPMGVVDVSKLPNMSGHGMSIVGPTCTTDMKTCVFECDSGNICTDGYTLKNCANGSQKGATYGKDPFLGNADTGGCGWNGANSASLKTNFY